MQCATSKSSKIDRRDVLAGVVRLSAGTSSDCQNPWEYSVFSRYPDFANSGRFYAGFGSSKNRTREPLQERVAMLDITGFLF